jgi:rare lipoprotein A
VNIAVTVALVPALFQATEHQAKGPVAVAAGATLQTLPVVATAAPGSNSVVVLGPTQVAADAATTTTTPRPSTTLAGRVVVAPKPTTVGRTTPTTARPAAVKPQPASTVSGRSETGKASWYDHDPGICAHKSLPFGTVVTVTDVDNGRSVQCTVGDRGPYVQGWIIDLNPREFDQLAPQSTGVLNVRITW